MDRDDLLRILSLAAVAGATMFAEWRQANPSGWPILLAKIKRAVGCTACQEKAAAQRERARLMWAAEQMAELDAGQVTEAWRTEA